MQYELIISNATDMLRVSALDIMGIKADGNYSVILLNDGEERLVLFQLGQLEQLFHRQLGKDASIFIRIGRGIILNREYLYAINLPRQQLTLRAPSGLKTTLSASKESLRQLKAYFDNNINRGENHGDE